MIYAYDLDDTLADTRAAVLAAYRYAGIEPPTNFWGLSRSEWLHDPSGAIHRRKEVLYPNLVRHMVKPLYLAETFRMTGGYIVTGASELCAEAVMNHLGFGNHCWGLFHSLGYREKGKTLNMLSETGIYFDDNERTCKYLMGETKWQIVRVLR